MPRRKRPGLKYKWSNGTYHSRPEGAAHRSNAKTAPAKKKQAAPAQPPPGQYDPALDAALGAAKRGYGDLKADFTRDFGETGTGGRMGNDYQFGLAQIGLGRSRALEDRNAALANVGLQYGRLRRQQAERGRAAGESAGLAANAARIRAANQTLDEAPINTAFQRQTQDFDTSQGRLGVNYLRSFQDAQTGLSRAGRETNQFGVDTAQSRLYQATQAGWTPPRRPRRRRVKMQTFKPTPQPHIAGGLVGV